MTAHHRVTSYLLEHALLPDGVADDVVVEIQDGRFTRVERQQLTTQHEVRDHSTVRGLTIPGLANCHSHAFHRALRGRTQRERGTFWSWREQMYAVAQRLDPDSYHNLARAVFAEMVATGYTSVGEFHYLHHQADGTPYDEPNAMGLALIAAADEAGLRIRLLDTCYLSAGFGLAPAGAQIRYSDGDSSTWAERMLMLPEAVRGAAIHSVRAVPEDELDTIVAAGTGLPLHVHLSEQTKENEDCLAATGRTPTRLLHDHGVLGPMTSAVHATHLTADDIALLGGTRTHACFCPTTERDLGDGIGPSRQLFEAGAPLTLGSDSQAVVDGFEEMRAVELNERLSARQRGHWSADELVAAGTSVGHASLGFGDVGQIAAGQRADLVSLELSSIRTAGQAPSAETAVFMASGADVRQVMIDGVVRYDGDPDSTRRTADDLTATIGGILDD